MKKTGELLRKAREEKGLSLHEIGLSLKINSKILKAIEDGDKKDLPAKTFLRGFVQSYAHYLKLNPEEVLKIFTTEMGTTKPQLPLESDLEEKSPYQPPPKVRTKSESLPAGTAAKDEKENSKKHLPRTDSSNFKSISVFLTLIILVALILFTKNVIDRYQKEAQVSSAVVETSAERPVEPPTVTSTTPPAETTPPPVNSTPPPNSSSTSTPFVSSQSVGSAPTPAAPAHPPTTAAPHTTPPPAPSPTPATSPALPVTPTAPSTTVNSATVKPAAPVTPPATPPAATAVTTQTPKPMPTDPKSLGGKNVEVIIEALDTVEIEYTTPGGRTEKATLNPEQVHTIKTKSGLKLNVTNGGAVNVIVNGKDIGVPGVLGRPIKLSY